MQYTESVLITRLANGPKTIIELEQKENVAKHYPVFLKDMESRGLVYLDGEMWNATRLGLEMLAHYRKIGAKPRTLVNSSSQDIYDGKEAFNQVHRPGAYDFLKCPSRMNGRLFYREESV